MQTNDSVLMSGPMAVSGRWLQPRARPMVTPRVNLNSHHRPQRRRITNSRTFRVLPNRHRIILSTKWALRRHPISIRIFHRMAPARTTTAEVILDVAPKPLIRGNGPLVSTARMASTAATRCTPPPPTAPQCSTCFISQAMTSITSGLWR